VSIPTLVIGAAQSSTGKTTVAVSLIAGLKKRGFSVQPFKVGPDYLDPSLLTWAAGRECRNLDTWMVPGPHLLELFHRACRGADIAVVEGVMGLFDGKSEAGDSASTAAVARLLNAPVVLVLDAGKSARTVGAVAFGLARLDASLRVSGAILNRVASERHREACAAGLQAAAIGCLGSLRRDPALAIPDRYLGLVSATEAPPSTAFREALETAALGLNLDAMVRAAGEAAPPISDGTIFPEQRPPTTTRIAIAVDHAFHFYYRDSLDLLEAWGAELIPFSPLADAALPPEVEGVYVGGGYPELYAAQLAANISMRRSIRNAHRHGVIVYAECGGAMYVGAGIEDAEGRRHPVVGLWPAWTSLKQRHLSVGYRQVRASPANFLYPVELPAHEFHYSQLEQNGPQTDSAWEVLDEAGRAEGHAAQRLIASYIHLHMGSRPGLAAAFVRACRVQR